MTLDKLYHLVKDADYPIRNRKELKNLIGKEKILFEGKFFDAEEISVHIEEYPIHSASDLIKFFIHEEEEAYNLDEAKDLGKFTSKMKS